MTSTWHPPSYRDPVNHAFVELRRAYAAGEPAQGVADRIAARVRETPQRRRGHLGFGPWSAAGVPGWARTPRAAAVAWTALVSALALIVVAIGVASVPRGPAASMPVGAAGTSPSALASPAAPPPTAAATSTAPERRATCPVTAITRLAGGTAPEIDASGLRWRWGGVPWVAGSPEKVVWRTDSDPQPDANLLLFGVRLDRSIEVGGAAVTFPVGRGRPVYAAAAGVSGVGDIVLPEPGCWLLTATWPGGASSVVVAVSPTPGAPDGAASAGTSPTPSARLVSVRPLDTCPANRRSADASAQGWPGPGYVDGDFRWLTPAIATWRIGGEGDKLVLDSRAGWDLGRMAIEAVSLLRPADVGWLGRSAVDGDIPPLFGGGTLGVGLTLPSRGCWAIVYAGSQATSTIVVDLGR